MAGTVNRINVPAVLPGPAGYTTASPFRPSAAAPAPPAAGTVNRINAPAVLPGGVGYTTASSFRPAPAAAAPAVAGTVNRINAAASLPGYVGYTTPFPPNVVPVVRPVYGVEPVYGERPRSDPQGRLYRDVETLET